MPENLATKVGDSLVYEAKFKTYVAKAGYNKLVGDEAAARDALVQLGILQKNATNHYKNFGRIPKP